MLIVTHWYSNRTCEIFNEEQLPLLSYRFKDTMVNTVRHRTTEMALGLGLLYSAPEALNIGLVDKLVPEDQVVNTAIQTMGKWLAIDGMRSDYSLDSWVEIIIINIICCNMIFICIIIQGSVYCILLYCMLTLQCVEFCGIVMPLQASRLVLHTWTHLIFQACI